MKKSFLLLVTSYWLLVTSYGCGYTTHSLISEKFHTIRVLPFVNKIDITNNADASNKYRIQRPFLETKLTESMVNRFLIDGTLKPLQADDADLVLRGELTDFQKEPLRYTDNDEVEEYRVSITISAGLWDNKQDKLIWRESSFTGESTYFTMGGLAASEDAAISKAITDLTRRIVERTVEQW